MVRNRKKLDETLRGRKSDETQVTSKAEEYYYS
jgi:hypothetical protein